MPFWIGCTSISIKWNHFIVLTFSQVFLYIFLVSVKILCDKVRLKAIFGCILLGRYISSCIDITATESTNITTIRKWTVVYDLSLTLVNISYYISYYWSHVPSNACIQTKTLVDTYEYSNYKYCMYPWYATLKKICIYIFKDKLHYHLVFKSNQLSST